MKDERQAAELRQELAGIASEAARRSAPASWPARIMMAWLRLGLWLGPRLAVTGEEREGWNGWERERYMVWRASRVGRLWKSGVRLLIWIFPER